MLPFFYDDLFKNTKRPVQDSSGEESTDDED